MLRYVNEKKGLKCMELQGLPLAGLISLTLKNTLTYFYKRCFGNRKFFSDFVMKMMLVLISMRLNIYG